MMDKMKRTIINSLLLFLMVPALVFGQSKNDKTVVGTVGDQKVTYAELKANASSGNPGAPTLKELEEFLPVYLDYKAKLLAAKKEGYFQDSSIVEEHKTYVTQAAYAYWLENEIKPSALDEYARRSGYEMKAYHILIAVGSNASATETEQAISKLKEAKNKIRNGADLDEINKEYSTVRGGRSMGGDLPWLSAGRTVKEFEDALYNLEVGEISEPFRTQFGYHIVILQDKRERTPARLASHIYVRGTGDSAAYDKIHEAYELLENGKNWNAVLPRYSEDAASVRNNGTIGWVSYKGNFAADFVDAVMSVDPEKPYSEPVKTNYGFHIFKIDSVETYNSKQERREKLLNELKQTPYYSENNEFVKDYLTEKFGAKEYTDTFNRYRTWVIGKDTTAIPGLPYPSNMGDEPVYEFNGKTYTVGDLHSFIKDEYSQALNRNFVKGWFEAFQEEVLESQLVDLTIEHFPEFKEQSKSYLNGLVIYNFNEDNVWSAATVDTSRLRSIYENNPQDYQYPKRPYYYLLTARHDSTLDKAIQFVNEGGSLDSLKANINRIGVSSDSTLSMTEEPFDTLQSMNPKTFSEKFDYNKFRAVFWLEEWLPARAMTFEESFNRIFSSFQPQREEEWIEELRAKYDTKANFKNLRKAYKKDS